MTHSVHVLLYSIVVTSFIKVTVLYTHISFPTTTHCRAIYIYIYIYITNELRPFYDSGFYSNISQQIQHLISDFSLRDYLMNLYSGEVKYNQKYIHLGWNRCNSTNTSHFKLNSGTMYITGWILRACTNLTSTLTDLMSVGERHHHLKVSSKFW